MKFKIKPGGKIPEGEYTIKVLDINNRIVERNGELKKAVVATVVITRGKQKGQRFMIEYTIG